MPFLFLSPRTRKSGLCDFLLAARSLQLTRYAKRGLGSVVEQTDIRVVHTTDMTKTTECSSQGIFLENILQSFGDQMKGPDIGRRNDVNFQGTCRITLCQNFQHTTNESVDA